MVHLPSAAIHTLVEVAEALQGTRHGWWLVGGAAVALQGVAVEVADIDVLMSARDARQVIAALGIARQEGGGAGRFRSDIFGRWTALPLGVDFMAGLQVATGEGWTRIAPGTRQAVTVCGRQLYVPSRIELAKICRTFGRPKDLVRAADLERLG